MHIYIQLSLISIVNDTYIQLMYTPYYLIIRVVQS